MSKKEKIYYIPNSYDENQSIGGIIINEPIVNTKDGFWKGLHFFGFGKRHIDKKDAPPEESEGQAVGSQKAEDSEGGE